MSTPRVFLLVRNILGKSYNYHFYTKLFLFKISNDAAIFYVNVAIIRLIP